MIQTDGSRTIANALAVSGSSAELFARVERRRQLRLRAIGAPRALRRRQEQYGNFIDPEPAPGELSRYDYIADAH